MDAVRTPLDHGTALALGNKRYRKQVLKIGDVHYQGGTFPVTADYLAQVVKAFDARAITKVPFQLADASNRHTEDPLRRFGTVTGLHLTPEGLDAVLELDDDAARLVDADPDFGVSVLIKHDRTTGEGQHYPAVLAHVLGTTDPVLTQLAPWQPELAASNDTSDCLDLLALTSAPSEVTSTGGRTMAETLTTEETALLRSLLPKLAALGDAPAGEVVEPDPVGEPELTNEQLEKLAEDVLANTDLDADTAVDEPELLAASHDSNPEVLALAQRLDDSERARQDMELRLAQSEAREAATAYEAERLELAQRHGIAPRITDIVRPLLEGTVGSKLALANGSELDAAGLLRKFIHELVTTPRLDLSQAKGSALDLDADESEATERAELAAIAVQNLR